MKEILLLFFINMSFLAQSQCTTDHITVPPNVVPHNKTDKPKTLVIKTIGMKELNILIYDRRGRKVFESNSDILGASHKEAKTIDTGWDGNSLGEDLSAGEYVYAIEGVCLDKSTIRKNGTIILTMEKKALLEKKEETKY
jgi:hypothetical protein